MYVGESLLINNRHLEGPDNRFGDESRPSASLIFAPIHLRGELQGIVSIQSYTVDKFAEEDMKGLALMAEAAGPALRRAFTERELQRRVAELSRANSDIERRTAIQHAMYRIAGAARRAGSLLELFPQIHAALSEVLHAENFFIGLYNSAKKTVVFPYAQDRIDDYEKKEVPIEGMLSRIVVETREPLLVTGVDYDDYLRSGLIKSRGQRPEMWLGVPLLGKGTPIGVMVVQTYNHDVVYTQEDVEIMRFVSSEVTGAIEYTRINEERIANEERYRIAISQTGAVPYQREFAATTWTYLGDGITNLLGYTKDEFHAGLMRSIVRKIVLRGECSGMSFEEALKLSRDKGIERWRADYLMKRKDGKERWIADSSVPLHDQAGKPIGTLGILQDVTEAVEAERLLRGSEALSGHLAGARTTREVAVSIADVMGTVFGWDVFFIDLYDPASDTRRPVAAFETIEGKTREVQITPYGDNKPSDLYRRVVKEGPLFISDSKVQGSPQGARRFGDQTHESRSLLYTPIRQPDGKPIGVISLQSYTGDFYTSRDLDLLVVFAGRCAAALYRTIAEERIRRSELHAQLLANLGRELGHAASPRGAGLIISRAADALDIQWDACFLDLYDSKTDSVREMLHMDTIDGIRREVAGNNIGNQPGASERRVLEEGAFIINKELSAEDSEDLRKFGENRPSAALMFAPARHAGRIVGFLSFQSYTPNIYTQEHLKTLQALADNCAGALERIRLEQAIRLSEERYALAARGSNDGLWDWDIARGTLHVSDRWKAMIGYAPTEIGEDPNSWFKSIHQEDINRVKEQIDAHLRGETPHFESEHRLIHRDGSERWVLVRGLAVREQGEPVRMAGSMTDVSARKLQEEQLMRSALHDPLTGLANRALLFDRLNQCLERAKRNPVYTYAVMYMDLDGFKAVNDALGHAAGDRVLHAVAERLQQHFRSGDTIARIGGDEFTIVLDDVGSIDNITLVAGRVLRDLEDPILHDGSEVKIGASIGIAIGKPIYTSPDDILRDADIALYKAKQSGKGRYEFYEEEP